MKRLAKTLLCSAAVAFCMATTAMAATMNYLGQWGPTAAYERGAVVIHQKGIYYSLKSSRSAPNRNRIPGTNGAIGWWEQVGTVGNTIHSGLQAPAPTLGNVGDFYIDIANNLLFGPKDAVSGWPAQGVALAGSLGQTGATGPKGDTGEAGPQGPKGDKGDPGKDGVDGNEGAQGPQGEKGEPGTNGADGRDGTQGDKGDAGEAGPAGPQGAKGEPGDVGPAGPQGPQGEKGDPGKDGVNGQDGAPGKDGTDVAGRFCGKNQYLKGYDASGTIMCEYLPGMAPPPE